MERKKHLYDATWRREIDNFCSDLRLDTERGRLLSAERFCKASIRKHYGFRLEVNKTQVVNNISSSAVFRDLAAVLLPILSQQKGLQNKHFVVRMDKDLYFPIIPYRKGTPVQWVDE